MIAQRNHSSNFSSLWVAISPFEYRTIVARGARTHVCIRFESLEMGLAGNTTGNNTEKHDRESRKRERERRRIWTRKIRDFFPSHFAMKRSMLYYLGARLEGCHVHTSRISTLFRLTNGGVAGHDFLLAPLFRFATTACCASAHVASFRERLNKT